MITCGRCGKENQDHYKFCLGCGAKLEGKAAKAPSVPPASVAAPGMTPPRPPASITPPPQIVLQPPPGVELNRQVTPPPLSMAPEPAPAAPVPFPADDGISGGGLVNGNGAAGGVITSAGGPTPAFSAGAPSIILSPSLTGSEAVAPEPEPEPAPVAEEPRPAFVGGTPAFSAAKPAFSASPTGTPALGTAPPFSAAFAAAPAMNGSAVAPPAAPELAPDAPLPAAGLGADMVKCPKCGKVVSSAYTFCGSCGYRLKGAAPAAAGVAPRTMFMTSQPAAKATPRGHLTLIRPDGTEGGMHPLHDGENLIGRGQGSLFDADPYLSPRHAEFTLSPEGLVVRDTKSLNGVFVKITQEEPLESGDVFRIGQELLRFDVIVPPTPLDDGTEVIGTPNPGYWGRISVIVGRDVDGPAFPIFEESIVLGRERGDILFPEDGYVSATHARITLRDGAVLLADLGSSNGTFFRIGGRRVIPNGSLLLMGQQLFRVSFR